MYPSLPFGPASIPTGPFFAILAAVVALEVVGRAGRRLGLNPDDTWNTGLLALAAGLIVARLWTILQFWGVYRAEPLLIVSLRPSGFALLPGLAAGLVAAYAYLLYRRADPVRVAAAFAVGLLAGGILINVSAFLTGSVVGSPSDLPWAARYFLDRVHPVGLYRAAGLLIVLVLVWRAADPARPGRTVWHALFGYALVHLLCDAFLREPALLGILRRSQVIALLLALLAGLALSRRTRPAPPAVDLTPGPPPDGEGSLAGQ